MANPTTNFGWVMPTSSSLVTNLPADFNTFGQAVDTSMSELLGGTTGQVLSKTSNTSMDFTWVTPTDQTPLTTKGDLFTFTTVDARLGVGTNGYILSANSATATGLEWIAANPGDITGVTAGVGISGGGTSGDVTVTNSMATAITTAGDLIKGTGSGTFDRLGIGSSGQVLTVSSGAPAWATPASGSQTVLASGNLSTGTTTTTFSSISGSYLNLRLVVRNFNGSGNNELSMRVNNDTGANYAYYVGGYEANSTRSGGANGQTSWKLTFGPFTAGNNSNELVYDFADYANTTTRKLVHCQATFLDANGPATAIINSVGGYSGTNAAISRIDLTYASNVNGGTYILYGVN